MQDFKERIIITGDVHGNINYMYEKVNKILRKCGKFSLLICTGDFFCPSCPDWDMYLSGLKKCPIETYILGPVKKENLKYFKNHDGHVLAPNIQYLGNFGVFTTSKGVRIAYISGIDPGSNLKEPYCTFSKNDIIQLCALCRKEGISYSGIDLLISSQWPQDITELDKNAVYKPKNCSTLLSWLVSEIKPRYHVCSYEGYAYERPPFVFKNNFNERIICSRFIALGTVSYDSKHRNLFALNLQPLKQMTKNELNQASIDETPVPFRTLVDIQDCNEEQYFFEQRKYKKTHGKKIAAMKNGCWFCLSDPEIEKHLVIAIGKFSYLALAKGGLVNDHLLICSIDHNVSMRNTSESTRSEINSFKRVLKEFFQSRNKGVVFFERNFKAFHLQIQAVPLPHQCENNIKLIFETLAGEKQITLQEFKKGHEAYLTVNSKQHYFHVELPSGEELLHIIEREFPIQFGRFVLINKSILNMADKEDWHSCLKSKDEELSIANKLRKDFFPFDFTMECI